MRAKSQFDKLKATFAESKTEVAALKALNEQLIQQQASLSQATEAAGRESGAALEQELAEARVAYSHVSGQLEALTLEYEAMRQQQEQQQQERVAEGAEANGRIQDMEQLLADARSQVDALMEVGEQRDQELAVAQQQLTSLSVAHDEVAAAKRNLAQQLAYLSVAHDEATAAKEALTQQLGDIQGAYDLVQVTLRQLQEESSSALMQAQAEAAERRGRLEVELLESSEALMRTQAEAAERLGQLEGQLAAAMASASSGAEERVLEAEGRAAEAEARATALKDKLGLAKQKFLKIQVGPGSYVASCN